MKIKRSLYLNVSVCISIFLLSCLLEHPPPFLPFFILACNPIWGLIPLIEPWPNNLLTTTGPNWHKLWKGFFSPSFFLLFSSLQRKGHNNILTKDWFHVVQITGWTASAWQSRKKNLELQAEKLTTGYGFIFSVMIVCGYRSLYFLYPPRRVPVDAVSSICVRVCFNLKH